MRFLAVLSIIILSVFLSLAMPADAGTTVSVFPNGLATVLVPANQYINVQANRSWAKVYKQVGGPSNNMDTSYALETNGTVTLNETVFGPYTTDTNVRIEAGPDGAAYSVGALAVSIPCERYTARNYYTQLAPVTQTTTVTLLATDLQSGLIVGTHADGSTMTFTLPTGTLMDTAAGIGINQGFEWSLINTSAAAADTITVAAGSGHTIVGTSIVASAHSSTGGLYGNAARYFTRKTAANTFITYRLN